MTGTIRMKPSSIFGGLLLATLLVSGCKLLLGPNKIHLRWWIGARRTTVEGRQAWERSAKFEPYLEEIQMRGLERNKTYCFWISTPRSGPGMDFAPIQSNPRDNADSLFYRALELTLLDRHHREIKYNDDWTTLWTDGSDTLAMVRLRTTDEIPSDTLYLRVSACGKPLDVRPFEIHITAYDSPDLSSHGAMFAMDALMPHAIAPLQTSAAKTQSDRAECTNRCICDTTVLSDGPILNTDFRTGHPVTVLGVPFEWGTGFPIHKERCAVDPGQVDDRLECMLHNFRAFWFKPPTTGVYMISLEDMVDPRNARGREGLDSIGLTVFSDEQFKIPDSMDKDPLKELVASRLMKICEDIIIGVRMVGSGKYLGTGPAARIVVGASQSHALGNGILLGEDSTYYVTVSAPMFRSFACKLNLRLQTPECDPGILPPDPANPVVNVYDFQNPTVQSTCNPLTVNPPQTSQEVAAIQRDLPAFKMESQWTDFCWYDIQATEAEGLDFEVTADFEGKLALYTYGDVTDYRTYRLVRQQLFGFSTQPPTLKFTLSPVPWRRNMRMLIAHNQGDGGTIKLNMTQRISLFSLDD